MKRWMRPLLVVLGIMVLAVFYFRPEVISLGEGEWTVLYTNPFGSRPGGSANADLLESLAAVYGEDGARVNRGRRVVRGKVATIYDLTSYDMEYLGQALSGDHFLRCTVTTQRAAVFDGEDWNTALTSTRTSSCIGYDNDVPDEIRA